MLGSNQRPLPCEVKVLLSCMFAVVQKYLQTSGLLLSSKLSLLNPHRSLAQAHELGMPVSRHSILDARHYRDGPTALTTARDTSYLESSPSCGLRASSSS